MDLYLFRSVSIVIIMVMMATTMMMAIMLIMMMMKRKLSGLLSLSLDVQQMRSRLTNRDQSLHIRERCSDDDDDDDDDGDDGDGGDGGDDDGDDDVSQRF